MEVSFKRAPSFYYSTLLHGGLFLLWAFFAAQTHPLRPMQDSKTVVLEFDPIPKDSAARSSKKQVVQTERATKTETTTPDAFLGEQTQRVAKQTISTPKTGTAPATARSAPRKTVTAAETTQPATKTPTKTPLITATGALAKFGIAISADQKDSPKPVQSDPVAEASLSAQARGEYVKGFRAGEETMLNTREFVFYGYFQRIRERLDRAWEKSLRDHLAKYFYRGRQLASETDYMTQLLVSLDRDGRITRVQIIGISGTRELDEAATKAFNDAGPFPNPPTGLVDNRGQVLVRWDFVLKT